MKLQYLCHLPFAFALSATIGFSSTCVADGASNGPTPAHDYPTIARVEYVNDCIGKSGGKLAALYQCSCAIDRIANALNYDDYVERSTYAKYATLPGQTGGIFRDSDEAKKMAKSFRDLESASLQSCGLKP